MLLFGSIIEATRWEWERREKGGGGGGGVDEGVTHPKVFLISKRERERKENCDMNDGWLFVFV